MDHETIKLLFNFGVPTVILIWGLWLLPRVTDKITDAYKEMASALNQNSKVISKNTKVLIALAVRWGCPEEIKDLLEEKDD